MINAWIVGLAGIWMIVAPFVPMGSTGNIWNDFIVGIVAAALGFSMVHEGWRRYLAGLVGLWLVAAGFIPMMHVTAGMYTNNVVAGILLVIAGFAATRHHGHVSISEAHGAH